MKATESTVLIKQQDVRAEESRLAACQFIHIEF